MAEKTQILSVAYWEKYGFTNTNTDVKKLKVIILRVQQSNVEPVLGTTLYDKIISDIEDNSLDGLYKTIVDDYLIDMMVAYCDHKATYHTTNQITNKTTGKNKDENIDSNTEADNNAFRKELMRDAKQIEKKLIGWLRDNFKNIPELCDVPTDKIHQSIRPAKEENDYLGDIGII